MNSNTMTSTNQPILCRICDNIPNDYSNCTRVDRPGERDQHETDCPCCLMPFEGEALIMHDVCQRTIHVSCLEAWFDNTISDETNRASCPICRGTMVRTRPDVEPPPVLIADDATHERVLQFLLQNRSIKLLDYDGLTLSLPFLINTDTPDYRQFQRTFINNPDDADDPPHYRLPAFHQLGSAIFLNARRIHVGSLRVALCQHLTQIIVFSPERMARMVRLLYANGWDLMDGTTTVPRVQVPAGSSLTTIIEAAKHLNLPKVIIDFIKLHQIYPNYRPFHDRVRMQIEVVRNQTEPQVGTAPTFTTQISAFENMVVDAFGFTTGSSLRLDHLRSIIRDLGGDPANMTLREDNPELKARIIEWLKIWPKHSGIRDQHFELEIPLDAQFQFPPN